MAHSHHHLPANYDRAFKLGIAMNAAFVVLEAGAGIAFNSVALISDAAHNLSDVLALVLAWGAYWLSGAAPTERRTYGMKRATILASLVSAVMLCMALGAVIWEALHRLSEPAATHGLTIVVVAGAGVLINGLTAVLFLSGRHTDLNIKGAYLHMIADAAVSLGVLCAGIVILLTGWDWVDPAVALVVAIVILASGVALLRESLDLAMDAVPRHIRIEEVRRYLAALPGVCDVHDLHIWSMSTTETALTVHLVVPDKPVSDKFLQNAAKTLRDDYAIHHPTIQIEDGTASDPCASAACD
jgi:cobalt-zinc-cadmium efflux system protein